MDCVIRAGVFGLLLTLALSIACAGDDDSSPVEDSSDDDSIDDDSSADDDAAPDDDTFPPLPDDDWNPDDDADDDVDDDAEPDNVPITDADGREIFLRGTNYMGLEFGGFDRHTPEDYAHIAAWGFNVVRIPIAWDFIEPEPGVYDMAYLTDIVEPAVGWAADAGLKVVLDFHQWNWCRPLGGNGMPDWICDGAWYEDIPAPLNVLLASGDWWRHPEYLDGFEAAWDLVSTFFAGDERIFAYDLFNEPMNGVSTLPSLFEKQTLRPFYARLIATIRENHPEPWIFIEPAIIHVSGFPFLMDPLPFERLIFSPHVYPGLAASGGGYTFNKPLVRRDVKQGRDEANRFGAPLVVGEFGMISSAPGVAEFIRDATDLFDEYLAGWTVWCWSREDGAFGLIDGAGENKPVYFPSLARPYPRATMGRVRSLAYVQDSVEFTMAFENTESGPPDTRIWLPPAFGDDFEVWCSDADGAWSWEFDAASRELTIDANPGESWHVVTVRASSGPDHGVIVDSPKQSCPERK